MGGGGTTVPGGGGGATVSGAWARTVVRTGLEYETGTIGAPRETAVWLLVDGSTGGEATSTGSGRPRLAVGRPALTSVSRCRATAGGALAGLQPKSSSARSA